jgi:glycosyltransferase involved in cell wall biosynthesis
MMAVELRKLLFISYAYPPTGGAGVQRSVKFTKYLPACGWRPTVLTVSNPSVPVMDTDLTGDLNADNPIVRTKTREPAYRVKNSLVSTPLSRFSVKRFVRSAAMAILQPDPQVLWNHGAYQAACQTLGQIKHEAIYVTGPPFSSFLLARKLKQRFSLPLVVDFRDEWLLASQYLDNHQRSGFAFRRHLTMFRDVLQAADAVITTTQASARELKRWVAEFGSSATVKCIYNGFDEDDFSNSSDDFTFKRNQSNRYKIVYTGTLWKLTDVSPLVDLFSRESAKSKTLSQQLEIVFAGRRTAPQQKLVDALPEFGISIACHDYLPHHQSIELARSADSLLLLLSDEPGAERVVPAKLFEYLALDKPIVAIIPEGETAELLRESSKAIIVHPKRPQHLLDWLASAVVNDCNNTVNLSERQRHWPKSISAFTRQALTRQLADVLDNVAIAK